MSADPYTARVHVRPEIRDALKVTLAIHPPARRGQVSVFPLTRALPLFRPDRSARTHRVRRGVLVVYDGGHSHIALMYWCGGQGFYGSGGALLARGNDEAPICVKCEANATRSGQESIDAIRDRFERVCFGKGGFS